ncbi:MAG: class I SAM-dependent methyltransferase [Synechococcales cyanobacterium]
MSETTMPFEQEKAEIFAEKALTILNSGALALMMSIGHQTRLFDVMATLPKSTSQTIAAAAQLHERYVRECLNALVTGGIVEYDASHKTYYLPPEHAAFLTRASGSDNFALFTQYIPVLASVESKIVDCFSQGGGVPYAAYGRFHQVMAEDSNLTIVEALEDHILPLLPGIPEALAQGIDVLDVGCGRGKTLLKLAQLFPNSRFRGYDLNHDTVDFANAEAARHQVANLHYVVQDTTQFDEPESYDLITTFDAVHDQAHPDQVLRNIYRALRPQGVYLMQDIRATTDVSGNMDHPLAPFLYTVSCMHCTSVSLAAGGVGLGTMWGRQQAEHYLREAGFTAIEIHELPHDIMNDYYILRKH